MSRVGKSPISVPGGVKVALSAGQINFEGPKGKLTQAVHPRIKAVFKDNVLRFERPSDLKQDRALHGTMRSIAANMIKGVSEGYSKELLIEGVGFKAALEGKKLNLALGFSHPVLFDIPAGLTVEVPKPTQLVVKGADKVLVGYFASKIKKAFPAEPYKGKGIRYAGETIRRKAGKTVTK
ncbi:MAG: 50S ribosomal protein L6 [Candidatus Omnitrophica bacterium]|nr:50S ribosomal protein L6 [Candidatus Omnitrophota bacterium]